MIQLSNDADILICQIYKEYLARIKQGIPRSEAREFDPGWMEDLFPRTPRQEIFDYLEEISDAFGFSIDMTGAFSLNSQVIVYMENRFTNGIKDIVEWAGRIKGAIPFV